MRRFFSIIILLAMAATIGCQRHKIIPEKDLAAIFHDAMLVNAFISDSGLEIDSMNIYEPIFEKHGYSTDDVRYTIRDFSRRKNARLSDVAEIMIRQFELESHELNKKVEALDTIDNVARRRFHTTLLKDTAVVIKGTADTALLRYVIPIKGAGRYDFAINYTFDEKDDVRARRFIVYKLTEDSIDKISFQTPMHLTERNSLIHRTEITPDDKSREFIIEIANRDRVSKADREKATYMTLHEIKVEYTPSTEECVKRLFDEQTNLRIFADTMIRSIERSIVKNFDKTARAEETAQK